MLEVEGVLPHVDADQRGVSQEWVLVFGRLDGKRLVALVVAEPCPAGALDTSCGGVHFLRSGSKTSKKLRELIEQISQSFNHNIPS